MTCLFLITLTVPAILASLSTSGNVVAVFVFYFSPKDKFSILLTKFGIKMLCNPQNIEIAYSRAYIFKKLSLVTNFFSPRVNKSLGKYKHCVVGTSQSRSLICRSFSDRWHDNHDRYVFAHFSQQQKTSDNGQKPVPECANPIAAQHQRAMSCFSEVINWKENSTPRGVWPKNLGARVRFQIDLFSKKKLEKNISLCLQALCFLKPLFLTLTDFREFETELSLPRTFLTFTGNEKKQGFSCFSCFILHMLRQFL